WYGLDALAGLAAAELPATLLAQPMKSVLPARCPGFGPVTLFPLMMYSHEPSALNVMSCGSYAVGMRPLTLLAFMPESGITAIEFDPLFTAYRVLPSRDTVNAVVAAPLYPEPPSQPHGSP